MKHIPVLMLTGILALMPAALAADAPAASPSAQPDVTATAPAASPDASAGPGTAALTPEQYCSSLSNLLDQRGIGYSVDAPDTIMISNIATLTVTAPDGAIESINITAHGDGTALSGETISSALACAIIAYSPANETTVKSKLLELLSRTSGQDSIPGLTLSLALNPDALELTLTPAAIDAQPTPAATHPVATIGELIAHCAAILPDGWTQTSYMNGDPPDVLLNIYTASAEPDELWDCARRLMAKYFGQARASSLNCGRLSVVFYSSGMTPLLSLGVGCADALASDAITSADSVSEFRAEMERLAAESDALLVKHYDAG